MAELLEVAGHRLEVARLADGPGPVLVFLHEGLGCVTRWYDFPRAVAEATGRSALVYSRRGYGTSEPIARPRPLDFMHDEALRVLPALLDVAGIEEAILVGHSDGASIALVYAGAIGARVRGVAALAPHVFVEDVCVTSIAALRASYLDPATRVRERLARHHADVDGAFLGWADAWLDPGFRRWDLTGFLPGVYVPLLLIQGEQDEYGTLAQLDAIERGVAGPATRLVLPSCGHSPQRDREGATLAAVAGFVRGLRPSA
jgi:pimeloyl-ACP methyl ester carboxylesterase